MDKMEGKAKEAYGAIIGDEAKKAEGRALQRKAEMEEEAEQREREPGKPRPRPTRPSANETSKSSRTRACWATWATRYPNSREAATTTPSQ